MGREMVSVRLIERITAALIVVLLVLTLIPVSPGFAQDDTATPTETAISTPSDTPSPIPTETPTASPVPATETPTAVPPTATPTSTVASTATTAPTSTATPTATPPSDSKITVVSHLCSQTVLNSGELNALDWAHQLIACPSLVLPDDIASIPAGHVTASDPGNPLSFDINLDTTPVADAAFTEASLCEDDLGGNLNGDGNDNHCWDQSGYVWDELDPKQSHPADHHRAIHLHIRNGQSQSRDR